MITLSETIARMKREIRDDVRLGRVPDNVKSFAELHDYVDANEYGGLFCEDSVVAHLNSQFGRGPDDDMPAAMVDFINEAQNVVNDWMATEPLPLIRDVDLLGQDHDMARTIKDLRDECKRWAHRYQVLKNSSTEAHDKLSTLQSAVYSLVDHMHDLE